jgi:spermidine/putrescine transport system ATP-binding protein
MNFLPAQVLAEAGGTVEVEAAGLGRMTLDAGQCMGSAAGGVTSVGFRPETLTILFEGQQATDREVMATVHEVIYFGDMTYYDVILDGTEVETRLSMRNVFGRPVLDIGTRTRIAWSPGAVVLFR